MSGESIFQCFYSYLDKLPFFAFLQHHSNVNNGQNLLQFRGWGLPPHSIYKFNKEPGFGPLYNPFPYPDNDFMMVRFMLSNTPYGPWNSHGDDVDPRP